MRNLRQNPTNPRTASSATVSHPYRPDSDRRRCDPAMAGRAQPIAISRSLGRVVVTVQACVDRDAASALHRSLVDLVDNQGNLDVALEFRAASPIARETIELIVEIAERVRRRGGTLTVNCPPPALQAMLKNAHPASP
jgi:hypothetical protein